MNDTDFLHAMMDHIIQGRWIPKVQVERALGPLLGMFLPGILTKLLPEQPRIEMILPEFPLKKQNEKGHQTSTNIDYLLWSPDSEKLFFVELKTDAASYGANQLENYNRYIQRIGEQGAGFLFRDLESIAHKSKRKEKYHYVLEHCRQLEIPFDRIRDGALIYLAPEAVSQGAETADHFFSFCQLPESIPGPFHAQWPLIRNHLLVLDENGAPCPTGKPGLAKVLSNIETYMENKGITTPPLRIYLGKTGSGKQPNYKVDFTPDLSICFRFGGGINATDWDAGNLDSGLGWEEFKQLVLASDLSAS